MVCARSTWSFSALVYQVRYADCTWWVEKLLFTTVLNTSSRYLIRLRGVQPTRTQSFLACDNATHILLKSCVNCDLPGCRASWLVTALRTSSLSPAWTGHTSRWTAPPRLTQNLGPCQPSGSVQEATHLSKGVRLCLREHACIAKISMAWQCQRGGHICTAPAQVWAPTISTSGTEAKQPQVKTKNCNGPTMSAFSSCLAL